MDVNGGVVASEELAGMLLAARGSVSSDGKRRLVRARALARAAVEVEEASSQPRFVLRRGDQALLVARSSELAAYAEELGRRADELAASDPLVVWQRAVQILREAPLPDGTEDLGDARLLRLAATSSRAAALSSRQEFYPRGMEAARALVLAHGSLLGEVRLKVDQVQDRVASRYPEAQRLPGRPELDALLRPNWEFTWIPEEQVYERKSRFLSVTTVSGSRSPHSGGEDTTELQEAATARIFEERLRDAQRDGRFLVLTVAPRHLVRAETELARRFDVEPIWFEEALVEAMLARAKDARVDWNLVRRTDAAPGSSEWTYLLHLAEMAMDTVEQRIAQCRRTVLLSRPGLLTRYRLMPRLERLRDQVGRRDGLFGLWMLVPMPGNQELPMVDNVAVPLLASGQRARIPSAWLGRFTEQVSVG